MYGFTLQELEDFESTSNRMRKSHSARCGHVKRRIEAKERLTGKTLDFALEVLGTQRHSSNDQFLYNIAEKLKKGIPLDDYEEHIMVDVILVHSKIKGGL